MTELEPESEPEAKAESGGGWFDDLAKAVKNAMEVTAVLAVDEFDPTKLTTARKAVSLDEWSMQSVVSARPAEGWNKGRITERRSGPNRHASAGTNSRHFCTWLSHVRANSDNRTSAYADANRLTCSDTCNQPN